jgi:SAM-dependent methyltransferase
MGQDTWEEHLARYHFVYETYATGCRWALDAACGSGFGSAILRGKVPEVVGADLSPEAIAHAKLTYPIPGLVFVEEDLETDIPFSSLSTTGYDLIVSFETIEHLQSPRSFLTQVQYALASKGTFICSTPRRGAKPMSRFHVTEYGIWEYACLLQEFFKVEKLYNQTGSEFWIPPRERGRGPDHAGKYDQRDGDFLLAVCKPL